MTWAIDLSSARGQFLKADLKDCRAELQEAYWSAPEVNKEAILDSMNEIDIIINDMISGTKTWDDFRWSDVSTAGMGGAQSIIANRAAEDGDNAVGFGRNETPGSVVPHYPSGLTIREAGL